MIKRVKNYNVIIIALWIAGVSCQSASEERLTIATAANMQFVIKELTRSFTETYGIPCQTIVGSSGKLTAQIMEGAPFDVFVSADMKYPEELFDNGLTTAGAKIYAYGYLVMWSMTDGIDPTLDQLTGSKVRHIAMANPKTAPYGRAAAEVLNRSHLYEPLAKKLVFGESIAQTNQFITSGAAEVGFTAKSVVLSPAMEGKGSWKMVDTSMYTPIEQGVVILKNRVSRRKEAEKFYNFLISEKSREILHQFGYSMDQ